MIPSKKILIYPSIEGVILIHKFQIQFPLNFTTCTYYHLTVGLAKIQAVLEGRGEAAAESLTSGPFPKGRGEAGRLKGGSGRLSPSLGTSSCLPHLGEANLPLPMDVDKHSSL